MKKKGFWTAFVLLCAVVVLSACRSNRDENAVSPTDDSSQFVTLTDAVPDAILEIRYYGTYNFVGARIDGYLAPSCVVCIWTTSSTRQADWTRRSATS
mgnify:CR=1 FL=1